MKVLYGTQTGNAKEFSDSVSRHLSSLCLRIPSCSLSNFLPQSLGNEDVLIFVCSTTGQGDEPDDMRSFWKFLLRKNLPANCLQHLKVAVFGLGDSSYPKFNVVAKRLFRRLVQLGATPLIPLGLGDDQHELGPDAAFDPWFDSLKTKLLQYYPLPLDYIPRDPNLPPPCRYQLLYDLPTQEAICNGFVTDGYLQTTAFSGRIDGYTQPKLVDSRQVAVVVKNERVTSQEHFQDVRLVEFDCSGNEVTYKPGDVLMVKPRNLEENVKFFFKLFPKLKPESVFQVRVAEGVEAPEFVERRRTWREVVTSHFDIQSIPRRYFFELLSYFSADEQEREKLREFSTGVGQQDMYSYVNRPRRNILEVLYDFPHTTEHIPEEYLFELIPEIKPRAFSIASSQEGFPESVQLLIAVVNYRTRLSEPRLGLCSNFLARAALGESVEVWTKGGTVSFPPDNRPEVPVIMIGPGTGCAPFRSYIQHVNARHIRRRLLMFFGCRSEHGDFYFKKEWTRLVEMGKLELFTAFSRDQEDKIYVQHRIREQSELLYPLIVFQNAHIYVAGNSKQMPDGVREALQFVLATKMTEEDAENYLKMLENQKRIQFETWS